MIKSYKIRIYPTKEQEQLMWRHIGACRFIWNYMLEKQIELYEAGGKHLSAFDMIRLLTPLKKKIGYEWLSEVSNTSLQIVCQDLNKAYKGLFSKVSSKPQFKNKKKSKMSYPVCCEKFYFNNDKHLTVQKIGKVRYKTDFKFAHGTKTNKFSNVRISYINGRWMLSFGIECENQAPKLNDYSMGIDLGVKDAAIVAYDDKKLVFHNINKSKRVRSINKKIKHVQCSISRKYESNKHGRVYVKTKNIERQEEQLRKLYARLSGIRNNYIHQTTHKLVSLLPYRVVMEDLNISGMMKNKHLSKAIQEQCFHEFIRQMKYKCEWNGIEFIQVDRFYPSSKTCHNCGCIKSNLKLKDRTFVCDECGYTEDRDFNAALNLMSYKG